MALRLTVQPARRALAGLLVLSAIALACWHFLPLASWSVTRVAGPGGDSFDGFEEGLRVYRSREELIASLGSAAGAPPSNVDFARQDLVRVGWQADGYRSEGERGPRFGELACRSMMGGCKLSFFIVESTTSFTVHRLFIRMPHQAWVTVPKGTNVTFSPSSPGDSDLLLAMTAISLLFAAAVIAFNDRRQSTSG